MVLSCDGKRFLVTFSVCPDDEKMLDMLLRMTGEGLTASEKSDLEFDLGLTHEIASVEEE